MTLQAKRHALNGATGNEQSLYDEDAEIAARAEVEAKEREEEQKRGMGAEHETDNANRGEMKPPVAYVETEDESALRSLIFNTSDVMERVIDIPEWKTSGADGIERIVQVLVRALNAKERAQFLNSQSKNSYDLTKAYPDLVILTARHPVTKKLLFKAADRDALLKKAGRAVERIAMLAGDMSGLSEEALQEMKKNS